MAKVRIELTLYELAVLIDVLDDAHESIMKAMEHTPRNLERYEELYAKLDDIWVKGYDTDLIEVEGGGS